MCFKVALENAAATLRLRHACQLVFGIAASPVIRDKPEPQQPIPSPLLLKGTCMLAQHISNMLRLLPHLPFKLRSHASADTAALGPQQLQLHLSSANELLLSQGREQYRSVRPSSLAATIHTACHY